MVTNKEVNKFNIVERMLFNLTQIVSLGRDNSQRLGMMALIVETVKKLYCDSISLRLLGFS